MSSKRNGINFGPGTLDQARIRLGLTHRQVWEGIGCGETTWVRWKNTGYVPRARVEIVVLFLDLDEPDGLPDDLPRTAWFLRAALHRQEEDLQQVRAAQEEQRELIAETADRLRRLEERLPADGPPGP